MNPIFKKLGLALQNPIAIINAPEEFQETMQEIEAEVHTTISGKYKYVQIFARNLEEAKIYSEEAVKSLDGDGHLWLCYPKGTSKKYKSDLNRDMSWGIFSPFEFEPVTLVAIDSDWSALRFRHVDFIKSMKRKSAATEKGKKRIEENKSAE